MSIDTNDIQEPKFELPSESIMQAIGTYGIYRELPEKFKKDNKRDLAGEAFLYLLEELYTLREEGLLNEFGGKDCDIKSAKNLCDVFINDHDYYIAKNFYGLAPSILIIGECVSETFNLQLVFNLIMTLYYVIVQRNYSPAVKDMIAEIIADGLVLMFGENFNPNIE